MTTTVTFPTTDELNARLSEEMDEPMTTECVGLTDRRVDRSDDGMPLPDDMVLGRWYAAHPIRENAEYGLHGTIYEDGHEEWVVAFAEDGTQASPDGRTYDLDDAVRILRRYEDA